MLPLSVSVCDVLEQGKIKAPEWKTIVILVLPGMWKRITHCNFHAFLEHFAI